MSEEQVKATLKGEVRRWRDIAERAFNQEFPIEVRFDLKGRCAGRCRTLEMKNLSIVRFNMEMLNHEGGLEHLVNETCPHEVAHAVQYQARKFKEGGWKYQPNPSHGSQWRWVMGLFGLPNAPVCHTFDLPKARKVKRWPYKCGCGMRRLTTVRHNRSMEMWQERKEWAYRCRVCQEDLVWDWEKSIEEGLM